MSDPGAAAARARLILEYDGGGFAGWAAQPGLRTVQAEVERALSVVLQVPVSDVALTVAGRTDAGVHAWGQAASYAGPVAPVAGANALLPDDVTVLSCSAAPAGFDARRDATSRAYCYRILARAGRPSMERGHVLHWPHRVDFPALEACASAVVGTHDFTAFTPTQSYHVRFCRDVLSARWVARRGFGGSVSVGEVGEVRGVGEVGEVRGVGEVGEVRGVGEGPELLEFWIEADTFMRHMNRILVGTMLEVAAGRRSVESFVALLSGAPRRAAGRTAPAHGLYLAGVGYGGRRVLEAEDVPGTRGFVTVR